jgi:hypothetical protein
VGRGWTQRSILVSLDGLSKQRSLGTTGVRRFFLLWQHYIFSNKSHVSAVVWGSGDATMELGVNVACVTHASLTRAVMCGDQIFVDMGDAL